MVDKTQRHRNHWTQWTVAEITFVEQHYGQLSAREIGERIRQHRKYCLSCAKPISSLNKLDVTKITRAVKAAQE